MKREKRLERGIESIEKQIEIHEDKRMAAEQEKNAERVNYYEKEIKKFRREKEKKKDYSKS